MKKTTHSRGLTYGFLKLDLKMKLTLLFTIVCLFQIQANSYSQTTKISLNLNEVTVFDIVNEIESISEFKFLYNRKDVQLDRRLSIKVKKKRIDIVLSKIFLDTDVAYEIWNKQIVLRKKNEVPIGSTGSTLQTTPVQQSVSGTVTDETGAPLPGASIVEKGTTNGVTTDFDGNFSLGVDDENAILVISYLGFATQEIPLNSQTKISVALKEDAAGLDEVVVVGYGSQSKRKLVSAVSTMKTNDVEDLPFQNMGDVISGRVSGLIVSGGSTTPGSTPVISIRGGGTPLIVIDGIVTEDIQQFYAMNPKDIENVSFLKDGAAAAVFGARASNGIIVVTTKMGTGEGLNINYSSNFAMTSPTIIRNFVSSYEWGLAQNDAVSLHDGSQFAVVPEADLAKYRDQTDPINFPNSNWYDAVYKDWSPQQQHHLSLGGGSGKTNYYFSLGYLNQGSIYESDTGDFSRYNLISNISTNFDKIGLRTNFRLNTLIRDVDAPSISTGGITSHVQNSLPIDLILNPDGTYSSKGEHPLAESDKRSGYDRKDQNVFNGQLEVIWDTPFVDGLSAKVLGNYKYVRNRTKNWYAPTEQFDRDGNVINSSDRPDLSQGSSFSGEYFVEAHVNYEKTIGKHDIGATWVYSRNESKKDTIHAARLDYLSRAVDQIFAGPTEGATSFGSASRVSREAIIGRLTYGYAGKYLIEGSYRYDGSDNFAPGKRWGFFPALSAGWLISEEDFMNSDDISILKLRASYASVGNDGTLRTPEFPGISRLDYIRNYSLSPNVFVVDGQLVSGFNEGSFPSPDQTWFTTEKYNFGLDYGFFQNRISGSVDYFYNRTTGFLQPPADVYTTPLGISLPAVKSENAFRRHGIEAALNYRNTIGDLHYAVGGNIVWNERLWEKFNEDEVQLKNPRTRVTHRKNTNAQALTSLGLYQTVGDIINNPTWSRAGSGLRPGDVRYHDINGDGKIDQSDRTQQGKAFFPSLSFGFHFDLDYKAWSLKSLFQGAANRNVFLTNELINENSRTVTYDYQLDYWTPSNTGASYPRIVTLSTVNGENNSQNSSFWLKNARYVRLKSLQLVYDFKKGKVFGPLNGVEGLSLSLSGTNLLTWSPIKDFIDPEDVSARGFNYPLQKVISLGVNASF